MYVMCIPVWDIVNDIQVEKWAAPIEGAACLFVYKIGHVMAMPILDTLFVHYEQFELFHDVR